MSEQRFEEGESVEWTNQFHKLGEVWQLVPAGVHPDDVTMKRLGASSMGEVQRMFALMFNPEFARSGNSYLIRVDRGPNRKPALYWPRVKWLRKVEKEE